MILFANQLALQFNIGKIEDFLETEDFHYMRIAENAGGLRPIIDISFDINDLRIADYLNTGNIITIMHGINEPISDILKFEIWGDNKTKQYRAGSNVNLEGAMYNHGFTSQEKSKIYKGKSYEVLSIIAAQNGMEFVTNVTKTNDSQTWYQSGVSDWNMTKYIAQRAYKDADTFFVYGFDNNNLYFYDLKKLLQQGIKWYLTVEEASDNLKSNVINIGSYKCDNSAAGINAELIGKSKTNIAYNIDTGEFSTPKYNLKTLTTIDTDKINLNSNNCKGYEYNITSLDEHAYSIEAQKQNLKNNIMYSSYTCHVPIDGQYYDFRLFDVVRLIPSDTDKEAEGTYFITGISKEYKNYQYRTLLTLNRESPNCIKGELLESGA